VAPDAKPAEPAQADAAAQTEPKATKVRRASRHGAHRRKARAAINPFADFTRRLFSPPPRWRTRHAMNRPRY
jgi:hypothetical protein